MELIACLAIVNSLSGDASDPLLGLIILLSAI